MKIILLLMKNGYILHSLLGLESEKREYTVTIDHFTVDGFNSWEAVTTVFTSNISKPPKFGHQLVKSVHLTEGNNNKNRFQLKQINCRRAISSSCIIVFFGCFFS